MANALLLQPQLPAGLPAWAQNLYRSQLTPEAMGQNATAMAVPLAGGEDAAYAAWAAGHRKVHDWYKAMSEEANRLYMKQHYSQPLGEDLTTLERKFVDIFQGLETKRDMMLRRLQDAFDLRAMRAGRTPVGQIEDTALEQMPGQIRVSPQAISEHEMEGVYRTSAPTMPDWYNNLY